MMSFSATTRPRKKPKAATLSVARRLGRGVWLVLVSIVGVTNIAFSTSRMLLLIKDADVSVFLPALIVDVAVDERRTHPILLDEQITFWTAPEFLANETTSLLLHVQSKHYLNNNGSTAQSPRSIPLMERFNKNIIHYNETVDILEWKSSKRVLFELIDAHFQLPPKMNETYARLNQSTFHVSDGEYGSICARPGMGQEGPNGYRMLTSKLQILNESEEVRAPEKRVKVFCAVYTYKGGIGRLSAILETWGKRCDGFLAFSDVMDAETSSVNLGSKVPAQPFTQKRKFSKDKGSYSHIWQRVRSIMAYLYRHGYLDDYDFFHINGDDTYLFVENLRVLLSKEQQRHGHEPLYIGSPIALHWLHTHRNLLYGGGGPGYTMSRSAVKAFVEGALFSCEYDTHHSAEDAIMGYCLKNAVGINLTVAFDSKGEERYHGVDAEVAYSWRDMNRHGDKNQKAIAKFMVKQSIHRKDMSFSQFKGQESMLDAERGMAATSVAIHLIKTPDYMRRIEKLLYRTVMPDCSCDGSSEPTSNKSTIIIQPKKCDWNRKERKYTSHEPNTTCSHMGALLDHTAERPDCTIFLAEQRQSTLQSHHQSVFEVKQRRIDAITTKTQRVELKLLQTQHFWKDPTDSQDAAVESELASIDMSLDRILSHIKDAK